MKKYLFLLLLLISFNGMAQQDTFKRHIYSVGVNTYGEGPHGTDMGLEVFYDVRICECLSLGGIGELDINPNVIDDKIDLILGGRLNFHLFNHLKENATHWDPYLGLTGGLHVNPWVEDYNVVYDCYAGVRYFIKRHWAIFAEVGSSDAIGVSFAI
ncbi:hypothetical protein [Ancylomarina sp. 16SWW S1-10-2]|uniref:hypothetical protein n=1 Tax=Ancylomarina sp. 16SWW S1-10-2 TaxID=2499681 RepID=UPI0012ADE31F|nr:hypothetical protein [Ancylomarina sp. 16SWW S1-10-2]MRT91914.1 hypothetical protein [Ancylomarina sp. 16SWW S1-10-2]